MLIEQIIPEPAKTQDLKLIHSQEYINVISKASKGIIIPDILRYTTTDNFDPSTGTGTGNKYLTQFQRDISNVDYDLFTQDQ